MPDLDINHKGDVLKLAICSCGKQCCRETEGESDGGSYLRCQSVTEVQDGGVVIVRPLV